MRRGRGGQIEVAPVFQTLIRQSLSNAFKKRVLYHLFLKIMISGSYWMLNLRKIYQKKMKDPNIIS